MKKIILIVLTLLFFVSCNTNKENKTIAVATFVDHIVLNRIKDSFVMELQELGYTKEKGWTIIIKSANGQPNEANTVADELLNMNPKVIVSISTPSTKPIYDKNQGQIPHIYSFVSFPENIGITEDAKNTTGLSDGVDFKANFEFIKEFIPNMKRLGMVYSDEPNAIVSKNEFLKLCKENGIEFIGQSISKEDEVKQACQAIASTKVDAIIVGADGVIVNQINAMIEVANIYKIPLFATDEGSVENGAFGALSVNYNKFGQETAKLTDEVIRNGGTKGIKQTKYYGKYIVLNLKTAKIIGVQIPDNIIKKAYRVIK